MKHLNSFAELATEFVEVKVGLYEALHHGLERVALKIQKTAVAEIGHYQAAAGPFPEWPLLADSTENQKARDGYPADAPLLATGDMQDSIEHQVEGLEANIGTNDEKAVYHEFGTDRMPARPFMGPAAFNNKEPIRQLIGAAVVAGFVGDEQIHNALGYDFETTD